MNRAHLGPQKVLVGTLVVLLAISCAEPTEPTALTAGSIQMRPLTQATMTVYGPVTFTRSTGKPRVDSAAFSTQPGDSVTFTITSDASQGLNATVMFNGVTVFATTGGNGLPVTVRVVAHATNTVRVSLTGKPGSRMTIVATVPAQLAIPEIPDKMSFENDSLFTVASPEDSDATYYRRQVELAFTEGTPDSLKAKLFAKYQASVVGGAVYAASYFLKLADPGPTWKNYRDRLIALRAEPGVRSVSAAERTAILSVDSYPSDGPGMRKQNWLAQLSDTTWALRMIRAPEAWSCENGTYSPTRVKVAIFEAAWPEGNRDFADAGVRTVWIDQGGGSYEGRLPARTLGRYQWHGLAVAGMLTGPGDDGYGTVGVSWRTALSVYHAAGGFGVVRTSGLLGTRAAIRAAAEHGDRILNLSSGFEFSSSDTSITDQLNAVYDLKAIFERYPQFLIVATAGNDSTGHRPDLSPRQVELGDLHGWVSSSMLMRLGRLFPALRTHFLFVASSTSDSTRSRYSRFYTGGGTDLFAPGEQVAVAGWPSAPDVGLRNEVVFSSGTSFAAPQVAGAAALLWAMDPTLSAAEVRQYLLDGARAYRTTPLSADSVASRPIYQGVHLLDVYGALRLLSNRKPGTPLCGVETRIVPGNVATVGVFRGSGGGTETALLLGTYGSGLSAPLPALSIAQGGRKLVVNNFGGTSGTNIAEVTLSNGTWSAPRVLNLGAGWQRAFLEEDTLDLRFFAYASHSGPPPTGAPPIPDSIAFEYRLMRGDGTVFRGRLDSLITFAGNPNGFIRQAAASPDGEWLALHSGYSDPNFKAWGERLHLVPLTRALGSVVLRSYSVVNTGPDEALTIWGEPFLYARVVFRPDSWSFWAALGDDLELPQPMVRYDRTNSVGGWTPVDQKVVETTMLEWTWLADPNVLLAVNSFGADCRVTRRASSAPQNYTIVHDYCPYALPAMMLRQGTPTPLRGASNGIRP